MTATEIVLVVTAVLLVGWDIYSVIHGGFEATISWLIYSVAKLYPVIPLAFGILMGHFFWSQVC